MREMLLPPSQNFYVAMEKYLGQEKCLVFKFSLLSYQAAQHNQKTPIPLSSMVNTKITNPLGFLTIWIFII